MEVLYERRSIRIAKSLQNRESEELGQVERVWK